MTEFLDPAGPHFAHTSFERPPRRVFWTDARKAELERRWAAGETGGQIANDWRVSRNTVLGKMHRMRLHEKHPRRASGEGPPKKRKPRVRKVSLTGAPHSKVRAVDVLHRLRFRAEAPGLAAARETVEAPARWSVPRSLIELRKHDCRWPVGDDAAQLFCAEPRMEGSSYCRRHWIISTRDQARAREILRRSGRAG